MTTEISNESRDPFLDQVFCQLDEDLPSTAFTEMVMAQADQQKRWRIARRVAVAILLGLIGIPLQDFALALAHILAVSLIDLERGLVAQLLAPVNSVGALLSVVLLGLRIVHKRIFA